MTGLRHRNAGFTLIELMLVVAIIGTICAVAIPSFLRYQNRAKRSEAYANLEAVAKSQNSYFAAYGLYANSGAPQPGGGLGPAKRAWSAAADAAFAQLGFRPEGNVYFDYDVNAACGCTACFTATAYGDVDGDLQVSALMYVHPDAAAAVCPSGILGFGTPVVNGNPVFDEVAWNAAADDF
jgi:prepilin-type N-terminal cleavage/methylation domain-containing protein